MWFVAGLGSGRGAMVDDVGYSRASSSSSLSGSTSCQHVIPARRARPTISLGVPTPTRCAVAIWRWLPRCCHINRTISRAFSMDSRSVGMGTLSGRPRSTVHIAAQPTPIWRRASTLTLITADWSDRRSRCRGFGDHDAVNFALGHGRIQQAATSTSTSEPTRRFPIILMILQYSYYKYRRILMHERHSSATINE